MIRLRSYIKVYVGSFILAPLMMVIEVCMDLLQPLMMAIIINEGVGLGNLAVIWQTGRWMLLVALIGLLGGVGCTFFTNRAAQGVSSDLRMSLFDKIQTFSFRQLDLFSTGSLITRITADVVQLQNLIQMVLRVFVRSACLLIGSVVMVIIISPRLSLILIACIPVLALILYVLMSRSLPLFTRLQQKLDRVNTVLQENTSGIRLVKAFVRSAFERNRFGKENGDYLEIGVRAFRIIAMNMPLMTLVLNLSIVAVLWLGGAATWNSGLPVGDLAAFLTYMVHVLFSIMSIGNMLLSVSRAKVSATRVREVLNTEADLIEAEPSEANRIAQGQLEFDRVSFSYDAEGTDSVLKEISFIVEPGQTVGILGATGSGKSSLVSLISRLYETTAGSVRIDGVDVRQIDSHHLRGEIALVLQQTILFSGTIRDNIRYGRVDASDEEVMAAARAAEADEFISRLAMGYETELGQRGINLSGGQKQRIAIARALIMRPKILILDDSTSAVDLGTESRIQQSLRELMGRSTCLIIAQRVSSVVHADQIIVLDNGEVSGMGTHDQLIAHHPVYQEIYRSQQNKEESLHA